MGTKEKKVSVKIESHQEDIEVGVIEVEVPFALSKLKLKEWVGTIDFEEKVLHLTITYEEVKLEETCTGHLVVNLAKNITDNKEEIVE